MNEEASAAAPTGKRPRKSALAGAALLFVVIGGVLALAGYWLRPYIPEAKIEQWVRGAGAWGPIALLGVQIAQILAAPIPGVFVPLLAGVLYGAFWGSVITAAGSLIGSAAAFWIGRSAGRRIAERFIGKETMDQAHDLIRGKRSLALIPLFLFPFSPADALCFMAGIAGVGWAPFLSAVLLGRIPKDVVIAISAALGWGLVHHHH